MTSNREVALKILADLDQLELQISGSYVNPVEFATINQTVTNLHARAQIHAILALTDPQESK